jgi:hypothetical protein
MGSENQAEFAHVKYWEIITNRRMKAGVELGLGFSR